MLFRRSPFALLLALGALVVAAPSASAVACSGEMYVMSVADLNTIAACTSYDPALTVTVANNIVIPSGTVVGPIGTAANPFLGTFDGNDNSISGLTSTAGGDDRGLFGVVGSAAADAEIKNLRLIDPQISGSASSMGVGALVGRMQAGAIRNVRITGAQVTGNHSVGVVVGRADALRPIVVERVSAAGSATAASRAAGVLIGQVQVNDAVNGVTISLASTSGSASASPGAGGLIGEAVYASGAGTLALEDVAARASASASGGANNTSFGGVIGYVTTSSAVSPTRALSLTRVYATGAVASTGGVSGGIVGSFYDPGGLTLTLPGGNVFWDTTTTGMAEATNAVQSSTRLITAVPKTTAQLKTLATFSGAPTPWPIVAPWQSSVTNPTWGICAGANDAYPYLLGLHGTYPCALPSAPTSLAAVTGSRTASLSFTAPFPGHAAITGYQVSFDGGGWVSAGSSTTATLSSLTPGTTYSVRVRAVSSIGEGPASSAVTFTVGPCTGASGQVLGELGTAADPYLIASSDDLLAVGTGTCGLAADHRQTADITMPGAITAAAIESNFTPIGGDTAAPFTGAYDGGGHTITGLVHVDGRLSARHDVGLFGLVSEGAEIHDVHLREARMRGDSDVGMLIGLIESNGGPVVVEDVSATGSAAGVAKVGGLVGKMWSAVAGSEITLARARVEATVTASNAAGTDTAGGAIGSVVAADVAALTIDDVRVSGTVTVARLGGAVLGGAIGSVELNDVTGTDLAAPVLISDVSSSAEVVAAGGGFVGGLIGLVSTTAPARWVRIERAAATGGVSALAQAGGLIGVVQRGGSSPLASSIGRVAVVDAFATGSLTEVDGNGSPSFGGLIGDVSVGSAGAGGELELERTYATGAVPSQGDGVVGMFAFTSLTANSALWNVETTGQTDSGLTVASAGQTTAELQSYDTLVAFPYGWPIVRLWAAPSSTSSVWGMCASVNGGYPFLLSQYDAMPCAVPSAPTELVGRGANGTLSIAFVAGAAGDSAITDYEVSLDDGVSWTSAGTTASPITVTGLANGVEYAVRVRAVNAVGIGLRSIAVVAAPVAPSTPATPSTTKAADPIDVARPRVLPGGRISLAMQVTGPGTVAVTGTLVGGRAGKRVCAATAKVKRAGRVTMVCRVDAATRKRLAKAPLRVLLTIAFTAKGGAVTRESQTLVLPKQRVA